MLRYVHHLDPLISLDNVDPDALAMYFVLWAGKRCHTWAMSSVILSQHLLARSSFSCRSL